MITRREVNYGVLAAFAALVTGGSAPLLRAETLPALGVGGGQSPNADSGGIESLIKKPLAKLKNPVVDVITLVMPPGSSAAPHRHTGQVFAYILEGELQNQVEPGPLRTYGPGDYFYEAPLQVHRVMRNMSNTKVVKLLITQIEERGVPFTIGV